MTQQNENGSTEVGFEQRAIDGERGLGALGGGGDGEVDSPADVAGHIEAGNVDGSRAVAFDGAFFVEFATQVFREGRFLQAVAAEKQCITFERIAVAENDRLQRAIFVTT